MELMNSDKNVSLQNKKNETGESNDIYQKLVIFRQYWRELSNKSLHIRSRVAKSQSFVKFGSLGYQFHSNLQNYRLQGFEYCDRQETANLFASVTVVFS